MAYPVRSATMLQSQASGTTFTPSALPVHVAGQLIILKINNQGAGSAWSVTGASGWTIATRISNTTHNCAFVYKVAASGSEAIPTINGLSNTVTTCIIEVWDDVDPTTPIDSYASQANGTGASSYSSPALTPGSNDCALSYWGCGNGMSYARYPVEELDNMLNTSQQYNLSINMPTAGQVSMAGHQFGAAAAVTNWPLHVSSTSARSTTWVIAIKNKSGGKAGPVARSGIKELLWGLTPATTPGLGTFTLQSPDNYAASITGSAGSVDVSTASATATDDFDAALGYGWDMTLASTENFASPASKFVGRNISATFPDLTGKVVSFLYRLNQANSAAFVGTDGFLVGFSDGTNRVTYQVKSKAQYVASSWYRVFIEIGVTTPFESSGSIDWAAVVDCAFLMHRNASSGTSQVVRVKDFVIHDSATKLLGGTTAIPVSFADMHRCLTQNGLTGLASKQGSFQYLATGDVRIGDGTNETICDTSAQGFEFPVGQSATADRDWRVSANKNTLEVYGSANDNISISPGTIAATVEQNFSINASSSGGGSYTFAGESFINLLVTLATNVPVIGCTFKDCDEIIAKGAALTNCTISDTTSSDAAIAFDTSGGSMDGCTTDVTGTSAAYHIELGTACESITLTDHTFTGAAGTNKVHVRKTTGTVTINISGSTTLVDADVTSEGATVSIVSDPVYQSVIVSGFTAGSRIQIYDTTNTTELFNGTASAGNTVISGSTATWTDPSAASGNRAIRVRVAYVSGATAKGFLELTGLTAGTTSGTASVTYPVTQVDDTTYNDNAIDGSTVTDITFTDASPDRVNVNKAGGSLTWPNLYAAFVYWMFTETGIADDFAYIDAPDTANYLLTAMKVRNTNAADLTITGGYGRDATSGLVADIIDTAGSTGNIFVAPDHVVPFATGSGVTAQDKIDIAGAVLTAATAAPIYSNIKQVNDLTVNGAGTEADPWGP